MAKKRKPRKAKPVNDNEPRPTRRVSDTVLMRLLDEHHQDSLSDIANVYQRLTTHLGFKFMKFKETIPGGSRANTSELALDTAARIVDWRNACTTRKLNSQVVMLIVAEGQAIAGIMQSLDMSRRCVVGHLRACLTVWSVHAKRCNDSVLRKSMEEIPAHCRCSQAVQIQPVRNLVQY